MQNDRLAIDFKLIRRLSKISNLGFIIVRITLLIEINELWNTFLTCFNIYS
jgi:hypothetical protein